MIYETNYIFSIVLSDAILCASSEALQVSFSEWGYSILCNRINKIYYTSFAKMKHYRKGVCKCRLIRNCLVKNQSYE